jgi:hypothetical protein
MFFFAAGIVPAVMIAIGLLGSICSTVTLGVLVFGPR